MAAAGDVNGDKLADFITTSRKNHGAVVVFGSRSSKDLDLSRLGRRGFRILAPGVNGGVKSVAGAGDVNSDGLSDLIVGTPVARDCGGITPGSAYVVFGKRSRSSVDVTRLGSKGFRIVGERRADHAGAGVAGGGDVNGDGLAGRDRRRAAGRGIRPQQRRLGLRRVRQAHHLDRRAEHARRRRHQGRRRALGGAGRQRRRARSRHGRRQARRARDRRFQLQRRRAGARAPSTSSTAARSVAPSTSRRSAARVS